MIIIILLISFTNLKKDVFICDGTEDLNVKNFVILHELAHIVSDKYGHHEDFETNFQKILTEAEEDGIINLKVINKNKIKNYCNICNC